MLWEALTGQRLFQGTDDGDVYAKVLLGKVDPPSLHAKGLSAEIDAIVLRGLSRDRAKRYPSAREMALALEAAITLAPPSQVGRWVEGLVGDSLAERTEQIAGIERLVDGPSSDATSSALMTIGGGQRPANEQTDGIITGARLAHSTRAEVTSPTQPIGGRPRGMTDPTVVDRPAGGAMIAKDSVVVVPQTPPRRRSGRGLAALVLLVVALVVAAGVHTLRANPESAVPPHASAINPVETHAASPTPPPAPTQPSSDWRPVPVTSPTVEATADPAAGSSAKKAQAPSIPSARPVAPRGQAAPQPTQAPEGAETAATVPVAPTPTKNVSSCDPPFYIDADGTKRYKRYCAGL